MMRRLGILILLLNLFSVSAQISIAPGMKMPDVEAEWLTAEPGNDPANNRKVMDIAVFSDIKKTDMIQTLRYIESLESKYRRIAPGKWDLRFRVIVPNSKEETERFLNLSGTPVAIALGTDINGRTFRNFAVAKVPEAVIGTDGAIVWIGTVMDLDYIIGAIIDDSFSMEDYRKISRMKMEMQTALRSGLPDVAAKTAEKILEKIPGDAVSIQTVLYALELKGKTEKAIEFLQERIEKCGNKSAGIRLLLLDRIIHSGDMKSWDEQVANAVKNTVNPDDKLNLAAFLINRSPKLYFPAENLTVLCNDILNDPGTAEDPVFHATALEIAAQAEYALCRIEKACKYQQQAVTLRKNENNSSLKRAQETLSFYQKIRKYSAEK